MIYDVAIEGKIHRLDVRHEDGHWHCQLDGRAFEIDAVLTRPDVLSILIEGKAYEIKRERDPVGTHIWVGSARYGVELSDPRSLRSRKIGAAGETGPQEAGRAHAGESGPGIWRPRRPRWKPARACW